MDAGDAAETTVLIGGEEYLATPCTRCGTTGTVYDHTLADKVCSNGKGTTTCSACSGRGQRLTLASIARRAAADAAARDARLAAEEAQRQADLAAYGDTPAWMLEW